jgi:transposase
LCTRPLRHAARDTLCLRWMVDWRVFRDVRLAFRAPGGQPAEGSPTPGLLGAAGEPDRRRRFTDPDGCRDARVRSHKEGSMQRGKTSTKCAGIDVGKRWLDGAVHGQAMSIRVSNDACGLDELIGWLREHEVERIGLEASGGYERAVCSSLAAAGFEIVLHQPLEVRLFARLKRLRAKNDRIDAVLIAAATTQVDAVKALADPRLQALAERLTVYEQISDQLAELRGFMEHVSLKDLIAELRRQISALARLKQKLALEVIKQLKAHPDLLARFRLLLSLPGVGPIVAASLVVRMPELGQMRRGQAAALLGVAPFDRDSGELKGLRFIGGGRRRPRRLVYMAALSAKRCDPTFRTLAERLLARGKPAKLVLVAVMRRLIEAANLVLARGQPWINHAQA